MGHKTEFSVVAVVVVVAAAAAGVCTERIYLCCLGFDAWNL